VLIALTSGQKTGLAVMAAVFVVFALLVSMVIPRYFPDFPGRLLKPFLVASILLALGMMTAVVLFAKDEEAAHGAEPTQVDTHEVGQQTTATTTAPEPATTGGEPRLAGDPANGESVYTKAGCGGCHVLQAAGSSGTAGPNLDDSSPSEDLVVERVTNGKGAMPSFRGQLSEQEIKDVAAYVVNATTG